MKLDYYQISWNSRLDGPGQRVVLFLQGCHLRCPWCHSPHSHDREPHLLFFENRCILCGKCETSCPQNVHVVKDGIHTLYRKNCNRCGLCIRSCPASGSRGTLSGALAIPTLSGEPAEIFKRLLPQLDMVKSIGGLTVSGGEPLLQYRPLRELFSMCKKEGIHTAVETCCSLPRNHLETLVDTVDCWLIGLRPVPPGTCTPKQTGDIDTIRGNLDFLQDRDSHHIIIRTPIIPGFTDSPAELSLVAEIMKNHGLQEIELLPPNPYSELFYKAMDRDAPPVPEGINRLNRDERSRIRDFFVSFGFNVSFVD